MTTGSKPPGGPHTLADHLLGALNQHSHDGDADHDHDHDAMPGLLGADERCEVTLTSIGVDIGSAGTQVAFAKLHLERADDARAAATRREPLYQSPVSLTPYRDGATIDADMLDKIIDHAFTNAGLTADDIDCGVVILTGTARERSNAGAITRRLAERCGDIVSASAGHHMEARLAAHGSGTVERSRTTGRRLLNIDIGGGTTKLAVCDAGTIVATAAVGIGGRLVVTDLERCITRLEPAGQRHAARAGFDWRLGEVASAAAMRVVAGQMADDLVTLLTTSPAPPPTQAALYLTAPIATLGAIDGVVVSGGVGEYVYGRERRDFCDLGRDLGRALTRAIDEGRLPWPLMPAAECIRATVLGAAQRSVQLSGSTATITNPATLLPQRNMRVVSPRLELAGAIDPAAVAGAIERQAAAQDIDLARDDIVLALRWQGEPSHERLAALAAGLEAALAPRAAAGQPLHIVVDGDIAGALGAILKEECGIAGDLMVLDGLALSDLDFVDLGRLRLPSGTVPVTIKTLVFRDEPVQKPRRAEPRAGRR